MILELGECRTLRKSEQGGRALLFELNCLLSTTQIRTIKRVVTKTPKCKVVVETTEFKKYCGLLDKISCTSTMHKNTAARRKSRFSRRLRDLKQG
ncbi:MAG TPA: hypothetical protein EYO31_00280 [Phycisphaerales bacterium]|nr:hypothetical protein [Phycisphaerales bacterium]